MLLQGPESGNAELALVLEFDEFRFGSFVPMRSLLDPEKQLKNGGRSTCLVDLSSRSLALPGHPSTIVHYQERKRSSVFLSLAALT